MTHHQMEYEEIIRAAGHRVTSQRVHILNAVCEGQGHTTLGEIYARARRADRRISRSTVYRTLDLLVALGLLVALDDLTGETCYEVAGLTPHHHLLCNRCGAVLELERTLVDGMVSRIQHEHGFLVSHNHLVLRGVCAACRDTEG